MLAGCLVLGNLVTLPTYKRQGAGSALTSWPFETADAEDVLVYLDTDQDGAAREMYERLGFGKVDEVSTDTPSTKDCNGNDARRRPEIRLRAVGGVVSPLQPSV